MISKRACAVLPTSSITWAFAGASLAPLSPTPTNATTGASSDFAQILIARARQLYAREPFGEDLQHSAYALDSTTIDLCLALFPWVRFRERKRAVKPHTLLDLHGSILVFVRLTDGKVHDVNLLGQIAPEPGAFDVMDRGYLDFERSIA